MDLDKNIIDNKQMSKIYEDYGDNIIELLIKEIRAAGKVSSGRLISSLKEDVQGLAGNIKIKISGEDYIVNVDKGRRAGSYPPISELSKWATLNGIPKSAVFAIAKSIFKFGIKPTNIISKTLNKLSQATQELEKDMAKQIEKDLATEIKKINN